MVKNDDRASKMSLIDIIESFIREAVDDDNGIFELRRGELAGRFSCVPSQINYVLSTRFTPERGYQVESRRGEGGYIRVIRVQMDGHTRLMHAINSIGENVPAETAAAILKNMVEAGSLSLGYAKVISAAISDTALRPVPQEGRGIMRASIMKQCLLALGR